MNKVRLALLVLQEKFPDCALFGISRRIDKSSLICVECFSKDASFLSLFCNFERKRVAPETIPNSVKCLVPLEYVTFVTYYCSSVNSILYGSDVAIILVH